MFSLRSPVVRTHAVIPRMVGRGLERDASQSHALRSARLARENPRFRISGHRASSVPVLGDSRLRSRISIKWVLSVSRMFGITRSLCSTLSLVTHDNKGTGEILLAASHPGVSNNTPNKNIASCYRNRVKLWLRGIPNAHGRHSLYLSSKRCWITLLAMEKKGKGGFREISVLRKKKWESNAAFIRDQVRFAKIELAIK